MVLPDLMESEDNLNDYIKLKNIEGKVPIKNTLKHEDFKEAEAEIIDENSVVIEINPDDEKLEVGNLDDVTISSEQESPISNDNKCDRKTPESDKGTDDKKKGILKYERTYSNKHVDFNMDLEFVPFDESKDFTIDIQIVEQMPKKIVSYAALFAQQKKEEEEEKLKKEGEEKEKQYRKRNKKRKYHEWKKNKNQAKQNNAPISEIEHDSCYHKEKDLEESLLSTEDEMDYEKDDFSECSYHSDTDPEEHSDTVSTESGSVFYVEDTTFTNQSEQGFESKTPTDELKELSSDTVSGAEIKQVHHNEPMENNSQNNGADQVINENCESSVISENNANNLQFFCVPAKKQRSNSLSDLDDYRKPHRFVVQRLPREIELIISRQLEKQYYE
ncbi:protein starmaker [Halyomorpha halys]|uniref:protein starmaker n=1 Tax=Halyomorpha halys TaxID=286706 RepID=UPI0006D4EF94|nr:protein starmaker-like [Halyomorpha halys]